MEERTIIIAGKTGNMAKALFAAFKELYGERNVFALGTQDFREEEAEKLFKRPSRKVVIDFTHPETLGKIAPYLADSNAAYITGVSGAGQDYFDRLEALSQSMPVVYGSNFSQGYAGAYSFIHQFVPQLQNWDRGVLDMHHARKKDTPSQTALKLAEYLGVDKESNVVALRLGGGVSEHVIKLANANEEITLSFRVNKREAFVENIVRAIAHSEKVASGLFNMEEIYLGS